MLLIKSVHFTSLRERMVDKNLEVPTPLGTLTYYNTLNTVYILLLQNFNVFVVCLSTSSVYLYLSTLLIAAGVLVLGKFKSTCTLLKYS